MLMTMASKDLFDLKIPIGFGYKRGSRNNNQIPNSQLKSFTVRVNEREQSFLFSLSKKA